MAKKTMAIEVGFWLLCVFCCVTDTHSQKIISFKGFVGNRSCTQPFVAREYLDKYYFQAELDAKGISLRDWWVFALVSPRGKREDLLAASMLGECTDKPETSLTSLSSGDSLCWKKGTLLNVMFVIDVINSHNGSLFRGLWSNLNSGSVQSKDLMLKTVSPEEEHLTVNGKGLNYDHPEIRFRMGSAARIKYCVTNVAAHELSIKFGERQVTSHEDCVMFIATIRGSDIDRRITVGINETGGICKRVFYRYFMVGDGSLEIDMHSWSRSISGTSQTFIKSLGAFLILTCFCLKRVFI